MSKPILTYTLKSYAKPMEYQNLREKIPFTKNGWIIDPLSNGGHLSNLLLLSLSLSQDKSKTPKYFHISLSPFPSAKGISSKAGFFDKNVNLSDIRQCELEQYHKIFNLTRLFETFIYVMVHILIQKFVSPQYLCTLLVAKNILNII